MILNRKRVYVEKMEAVAAAEAKAEAEARIKVQLKEWYDANKDKMSDVAPLPWLDNETNNNGDRH